MKNENESKPFYPKVYADATVYEKMGQPSV